MAHCDFAFRERIPRFALRYRLTGEGLKAIFWIAYALGGFGICTGTTISERAKGLAYFQNLQRMFPGIGNDVAGQR